MTEKTISRGGVPMVKIDGGRIRALREEKGLTQLYLASAVEVTTDTISRWENRRYPTIKKENALKLAEALEVGIDDILEVEEKDENRDDDASDAVVEQPGPQQQPSPPPEKQPSKAGMHLRAAAAAALVAVIVAVWGYFGRPQSGITATRMMPSHTAPGMPFPVVVTVESEHQGPLSVILRETLPDSAELFPAPGEAGMAVDSSSGEMKWIHKLKNGRLVVGYQLRSPTAVAGETLLIDGTVNLRRFKGAARRVAGDTMVAVAPYHWADENRDNRIDDQEILAVYEDYAEVEGISLDLELIEEIWFGSGYHWDAGAGSFVIEH